LLPSFTAVTLGSEPPVTSVNFGAFFPETLAA
jgi:hypothetical protein